MNVQRNAKPDVYLEEYTRQDIIARYISQTAGAGIAYVLTHVYAPIYFEALQALLSDRPKAHRFRVLEYGCGGAMNLLKLVQLLQAQRAELDRAYGTDFSPPMIDAARREAMQHLPAELNAKLIFAVANNETLSTDLGRALSIAPEQLRGTFDLIVGVNTFRYCHRLQKESESARDLFQLLSPGGWSIMIDMNRHFPFFRSKLRNMFKRRTMETYVPSLAEYTQPFADAGFVVKQSRNFCWIPHSANSGVLWLGRSLTPVLDACCSRFAMRSLVVAQKPR